jgi:hypothetical protein
VKIRAGKYLKKKKEAKNKTQSEYDAIISPKQFLTACK